ncbi:MAG: FHA domain-containing protein [Candidatus Binataceae bacterium]
MTDVMTRCSHGHFYDATKNSSCPYCGVNIDPVEGKTRRVPQTPPPAAARPAASAPIAEPGATRAVYREAATGVSPVVGWLVCVAGPDRGRDYRIHAEKNFIGRSPSMDIAIAGDESVSREKHAAVAFDPKKAQFWLLPGEASGLLYLNDQLVNTPSALKARDVLELGNTKLMFWPLCDEKFRWE